MSGSSSAVIWLVIASSATMSKSHIFPMFGTMGESSYSSMLQELRPHLYITSLLEHTALTGSLQEQKHINEYVP